MKIQKLLVKNICKNISKYAETTNIIIDLEETPGKAGILESSTSNKQDSSTQWQIGTAGRQLRIYLNKSKGLAS